MIEQVEHGVYCESMSSFLQNFFFGVLRIRSRRNITLALRSTDLI